MSKIEESSLGEYSDRLKDLTDLQLYSEVKKLTHSASKEDSSSYNEKLNKCLLEATRRKKIQIFYKGQDAGKITSLY